MNPEQAIAQVFGLYEQHGTADYIGEPVNLAAKLCAAAAPGEILADCPTDGLPDWVRADAPMSVHVRGVGRVDGIQRLVPAA